MLHDAIGIDPDAVAGVAALVRRNGTKAEILRFSLNAKGRDSLTRFIHKIPGVLVGIEGCHGQSLPLEEHFNLTGIRYFSVPPWRIENYRKAMVGPNKNNGTDARAVAEFLLDLEAKGQLERFNPPPPPDRDLQALARRRLAHGQHHTALVNRLWKLLKAHAGDLYLVLREPDGAKIKLDSRRLLTLFSLRPELESWKSMDEDALLTLFEGRRGVGWNSFLHFVQTTGPSLSPLGPAAKLLIRQTAEQLLASDEQQKELDQALTLQVSQRPLVSALVQHYRGMGPFTAALIMGELITITRFPNDDHLASYAGLTRRDHSTGSAVTQVPSRACNTRLKAAFINLARNVLLLNKGSHLEHYHRHLLGRGISPMEALKRIARALVRELYRFLKQHGTTSEDKKGEAVALVTDFQLAPLSTGNTTLPSISLLPSIPVVKRASSP